MSWYIIRYYNEAALANDLPKLRELMEKVLEYAVDTNRANIYNLVASRRCDIYGGFIDYQLSSVMICHVLDHGSMPQTYLVYLLASDRKIPEEMYVEGMKELNDRAKQLGCSHLEMWTVRDKAFSKILEPHGWRKGYTSFLKEVV